MSVYNVVIMCVIGGAVSFILADEQDVSYVIISIFIIFCTTGNDITTYKQSDPTSRETMDDDFLSIFCCHSYRNSVSRLRSQGNLLQMQILSFLLLLYYSWGT